ncbi:MAG: SpoIIE family protein phosphatase [Magnetococcales bacterium]|nr:SpoIIE family protein phosphatase [Magnetococcales bacterium]
MKLRSQLAITLIPLLVLPLLLFGWLAGDHLVESRRQAVRAEMNNLLLHIESNAAAHLAAIRANVDSFSRSNLVNNYVALEEAETRYSVFQTPLLELFASYASVYPEYYEFRILMPDGSEDARYSTGSTPNKEDEEAETPYFRRMKESAAEFFTEFIINPDNDQAAMLASKRLTVQTATRTGLGKEPLQAYLAVTIRPDFLTAQLTPLRIGQQGFAFLTDGSGRILIGPGWRNLPQRLNDHDWSHLAALAKERRFDQLPWMGGDFLLKGTLLSDTLYLFTAVDQAELTEGMRTLYGQVVAVTLAAIVLLFPLLYGFLNHQFVLPLLQLSRASQEVGRGNFTVSLTQKNKNNENNELGILMRSFQEMVQDLGRLQEESRTYTVRLEREVSERTAELHNKNDELQHSLGVIAEANKKIQDSIQYAQRIQQALLPDWIPLRSALLDSFVLWEPRDVVGGDIYFADVVEETILLALLDCTGHGVPGAFMTMIAVSGLKRLVRDEGIRDPADLLKALNFVVKTTLQQDTGHAQSNDGLDAGIVGIDKNSRQIRYAGAKMALIILQGEVVQVIKGDNKSLGYKDSLLDFTFTTHTRTIEAETLCYLATDGVTDQLGGAKGIALGNKRLHALLQANRTRSMEEQKTALQAYLRAYQGEMERMDDVTVLGFKP